MNIFKKITSYCTNTKVFRSGN